MKPLYPGAAFFYSLCKFPPGVPRRQSGWNPLIFQSEKRQGNEAREPDTQLKARGRASIRDSEKPSSNTPTSYCPSE